MAPFLSLPLPTALSRPPAALEPVGRPPVGKEMACVARDPDADEYLFYTMEVGKCTR